MPQQRRYENTTELRELQHQRLFVYLLSTVPRAALTRYLAGELTRQEYNDIVAELNLPRKMSES